ncbi:hypothetical protein PGT21_012093 [Puccinia graminis f. sp. tritici]|uniref:Uncharacterized protein n=1 Tax=Puccinia graminis f. sp. tritici TaxID=56615 RepID=A0A5B0PKC2_PUCGR|nr:hypothetical protein PGT21_012093 [Puccinia graminis f. sp. tritici]
MIAKGFKPGGVRKTGQTIATRGLATKQTTFESVKDIATRTSLPARVGEDCMQSSRRAADVHTWQEKQGYIAARVQLLCTACPNVLLGPIPRPVACPEVGCLPDHAVGLSARVAMDANQRVHQEVNNSWDRKVRNEKVTVL